MPSSMTIEIQGNRICLQREQWQGHIAYISNYPGLADAVAHYTWTYSEGEHPYLNCSKLGVSLHKYVLQFLYGEDKLDEMLAKSNIIEHLDNNGLNCTYENLHVLSSDLNKAKAFSIDKKNAALAAGEITCIPALITDVYYAHERQLYQLQVFFNKNLVINTRNQNIVESFTLQYRNFDNLFIDWLYCFECIREEKFDIRKHHADTVYVKEVPPIELREDEKDAVWIERNGQYYFVLRTEPEKGQLSFMAHTVYQNLDTEIKS